MSGIRAALSGHRRSSVLTQQCQLVRYLTGCRTYSTNEAWRFVDELKPRQRREMYRMLRTAQRQGFIVWEHGRLTEKRRAVVT